MLYHYRFFFNNRYSRLSYSYFINIVENIYTICSVPIIVNFKNSIENQCILYICKWIEVVVCLAVKIEMLNWQFEFELLEGARFTALFILSKSVCVLKYVISVINIQNREKLTKAYMKNLWNGLLQTVFLHKHPQCFFIIHYVVK